MKTKDGKLNYVSYLLVDAMEHQLKLQNIKELIKAIVHNDYTKEVFPVFEIYSDRITITSYGGLVSGLSIEDFFECRSMCRNRELMRVFQDLDLVEQLGSGIARILKVYDRSIFDISDNFIVVTFKFPAEYINVVENDLLNDVIREIKKDKKASASSISKILNVSERSVQRAMKSLRDKNILHRVGPGKGGYWEITV